MNKILAFLNFQFLIQKTKNSSNSIVVGILLVDSEGAVGEVVVEDRVGSAIAIVVTGQISGADSVVDSKSGIIALFSGEGAGESRVIILKRKKRI